MKFKCPYTEVCRAQALKDFAEIPELAAIFTERLQCSERDAARAHRCAVRLGLIDVTIPTMGKYVQTQRRASQIPQATLAQQAYVDLQLVRDLELDKVDPLTIPHSVIERIAKVISTSADYLIALARASQREHTRQNSPAFARKMLPSDDISKDMP